MTPRSAANFHKVIKKMFIVTFNLLSPVSFPYYASGYLHNKNRNVCDAVCLLNDVVTLFSHLLLSKPVYAFPSPKAENNWNSYVTQNNGFAKSEYWCKNKKTKLKESITFCKFM